MNTAALVNSLRADLDPDLHDGDIDVAMWLIEETPERTWTPSEVARALRIPTAEARRILVDLAAEGMIKGDDRGAWTRYSAA